MFINVLFWSISSTEEGTCESFLSVFHSSKLSARLLDKLPMLLTNECHTQSHSGAVVGGTDGRSSCSMRSPAAVRDLEVCMVLG